MNNKGNITVIYLSWLPYGTGHFEAFLRSYQRYRAGANHELMIVFNGVTDESLLVPFHAILQRYQVKAVTHYKSAGQDIEAYFEAAALADGAELLLFLNTYSQLLADDWLLKYLHAMENDQVGLVGATASWQSYYQVVLRRLKASDSAGLPAPGSLGRYKLLLKAFFYWRWLFPSFPNPHVRSNAFMMRRQDFLKIQYKPFRNKFRAYLFESGRNGMTRQIIRKGRQVLVVGKDGSQYPLGLMKDAHVFWSGRQENLLVSDNQTKLYDEASEAEKKEMFARAWCPPLTNQRPPTSF